MGYWVKTFVDGTNEYGSDTDVLSGIASWSRGKLYNIHKVSLTEGSKSIIICGSGDYWQSDDYESVFPYSASTRIRRRIERKIKESDKFFTSIIYSHTDLLKSTLKISFNKKDQPYEEEHIITKDMHNKWLITEIDIKKKSIYYYINSTKI